MKQKLIFTALPNGINSRSGKLKMSIAISPQVIETASNTKLSAVADMLNWPELINKTKFIVQLNGATVEAVKTSPAADAQLWKNLFSPTVNVNAFVQEDKTNIPILSYPVKHVADYIKLIVEATGKKFITDLPDANFYTSNPFFTGISNYTIQPYPESRRQKPTLKEIATDNRKGDRLKRLLKSKPFIPYSATPNPATDFAQLCNFHGLYDVKQQPTFTQFSKPDLEFHDIVSVITQYPKLMRRLGLVIDFEIPAPPTLSLVGAVPALRAYPTNLNATAPTTLVCPGTAYEITSSGFYTRAQTGSFYDKGHVKINTDAFTVFQIDTDGAALKLTNHVDALQLKKAKHIFYAFNAYLPNAAGIPIYNNEATPRREGLPSHRTAGIGLAKNGMAEYLNSRFVRMNVLKAAMAATTTAPLGVANANATYVLGSEVLYADDVNLGYRMDVKMTDKPASPDSWHSLHFHENNYSFINSANVNVGINDIGLDEGFIQISTSEDKNIDGPHMKLSEVIARWEGWSLAVPTPGLALNEPTLNSGKEVENNDADEANKYKTPNDIPFKLNVMPVVSKGSLPRLRFGQTYAVKLRMVDMAGNSVSHLATPENATEAVVSNVKYLRYEPVDTPFLIPGNSFRDGESSELLAIRSNEGQTVQAFETAMASGFADTSTRHVKPPRTTVGTANNHAMLEQAIGKGSAGIDAVYNKIKNDKDPAVKSDPPTNLIKFDADALAAVANPDAVSVNVEYLVDPMATGVSFFISALDPNIKLPADLEKYNKRVSFYFNDEVKTEADANKDFNYDAWMAPKSFRIILKEAAQFAFEWSGDAQRKLTISMPKGFMLKLNYACFWKPKDIVKQSGILNMMGLNTLDDAVGQSIAKGQHWLFSPYRTLTLVHALQQPATQIFTTPNKLPFINAATSTRNFGGTDAGLNIEMEIHGASTGVVDVEGNWTDWVDDVNDATHKGVQQITKAAKVYHFTSLYAVYKYVFGDFPNKNINNNPFKALPHHFNDTKHRWVDYKTIASTRYKEYFFNLIETKKDAFKITRESNVIKRVNVLSSARPLAPQVAYVIPNFEWGKDTQPDGTMINGRGSGLRVYIKRPWYSSGEGEKLAVVIFPPLGTNAMMRSNTEFAERFCTTWGNDPTKSSPAAGGIFPVKEAFVGVKKGTAENLYTEDKLTVAELEGAAVNIVAYDVAFDEERQLYYVDMMLNFGVAYYPFVRLALAAYQQHSVRKDGKDCCLSPIVEADYIQIPPPRFSSIKKNGANITVAISGSISPINNPGNYMPKVEFVIEPLEYPKSENVVISVDSKPIDSYSATIANADIKNFTFYHNHEFKLPTQYATKPYRVKIFEYEMITYDPRRQSEINGGIVLGNLAMKQRMVFADVYEVNV